MLTDQEMRDKGPPKTYDNTMITTAEACWRKFYWFWRGLDYASKPPFFVTGQAHQEALDAWYCTGDVSAAHLAIGHVWARENTYETDRDNAEINHTLIDMYTTAYPTERFQVQVIESLTGSTIELGFKFPLPGTRAFLAGAIDGYLDWSGYGLLVLENKTSGIYLSDNYLRQWSFSFQVTQYLWALSQIVPAKGVLMNIACKRITQKARQAFAAHGEVPDGIFARSLETRSEQQLQEFVANCRSAIRQFEYQFSEWIWPKTRNPIECVGGIGKSPCPYQHLCSIDQWPWELSDPVDAAQGQLCWRKERWKPWQRGDKHTTTNELPESFQELDKTVTYHRERRQ